MCFCFHWGFERCHQNKEAAFSSYAEEAKKENEPPHKKIKVEVIDVNNMDICDLTPSDSVRIKFKGMCWTEADKDAIISGKLSQIYISMLHKSCSSGSFHTFLVFNQPYFSQNARKLQSQQHMLKLSTLVEITGLSP